MMIQRRRMLANSYVKYTKLNYLGATGAQFFSTGVIPNNNTGVVIKFRQSTALSYSFAVREGSYRYYVPQITSSAGNYHWAYGLGTSYVVNPTYQGTLGTDYVISFNLNGTGQIYVGETLIATLTPNVVFNNPALMFGNYLVGSTPYPTDYFTGRIYYCKVFNGANLIRDYIPVLDGSGIPCMYDKVGRKFYYNEGTGVFNYG